MKVREIPLEKIFIKKNIRTDTDEELGEQMKSMCKYGQLQNAAVYPRGERYELVFGHRRFRAAQMNNEQTLACLVLDPELVSEADIPVIKLQENMIRKQLSNAEVLAAADAIIAAHPGMKDKECDLLLGKRPGWLGFRRSVSAAYEYLEQNGLSATDLKAMTTTEVIELRARMQKPHKPGRGNKGLFNRGCRTPEKGIQILTPRGPNVVVVCAGQNVKARVIRHLRELAKTIA